MNAELIKFKEITIELKRTYISNLTRTEYECVEIAVPSYNDTFTYEAFVKLTHPTKNDLKLTYRQFRNLFTPNHLYFNVGDWAESNRSMYLIMDINDDEVTLELVSFDSVLVKVPVPEFVSEYHKCTTITATQAKDYNARNSTYMRKHQRNLEIIGEK